MNKKLVEQAEELSSFFETFTNGFRVEKRYY